MYLWWFSYYSGYLLRFSHLFVYVVSFVDSVIRCWRISSIKYHDNHTFIIVTLYMMHSLILITFSCAYVFTSSIWIVHFIFYQIIYLLLVSIWIFTLFSVSVALHVQQTYFHLRLPMFRYSKYCTWVCIILCSLFSISSVFRIRNGPF